MARSIDGRPNPTQLRELTPDAMPHQGLNVLEWLTSASTGIWPCQVIYSGWRRGAGKALQLGFTERLFRDASIIEAGIDWLTVTAKGEQECQCLSELATGVYDRKTADGYEVKEAHLLQYVGYTTEGCFYGTRKDGGMLRLSGAIAHELATEVPQDGIHLTRVDLQVTVKVVNDDETHIPNMVREQRARGRRLGNDSDSNIPVLDGARRGSTATYNERTAAAYGRLYDKHREKPEEYQPGSLRFELETKQALAGDVFRKLQAIQFETQAIAALTLAWFADHGVDHRLHVDYAIEMPKQRRHQTDVERLLKWLRGPVRSVIRKLCAWGYEAEVADALYGWLTEE